MGKASLKNVTIIELLVAINRRYSDIPVYRFGGQISSLICLNKMRNLLSKKGAHCKGEFICSGFHAKFKTYKGRPCEKEITRAKKFARKIAIN